MFRRRVFVQLELDGGLLGEGNHAYAGTISTDVHPAHQGQHEVEHAVPVQVAADAARPVDQEDGVRETVCGGEGGGDGACFIIVILLSLFYYRIVIIIEQ